MKRFFLFTCFIFSFYLLFGCCVKAVNLNQSKPNYSDSTIISHVENSTVRISYDEFFGTARCAGVWINDYDILTAKHCVSYIDTYVKIGDYVNFSTYEEFNERARNEKGEDSHLAVIIAYSENTDLAIISSLDSVNHSIARVANKADHSSKVHIVGHPAGYDWTYMSGTISGETYMRTWKVYHITALIYFGSSGGGAFNTYGSLIGIASLFRDDIPGMSFFIHLDLIKEFLTNKNIKYFKE